MGIKGTTRLIGILGNPVHHSLSPVMHNAAYAHYGLDLAYIPLPVAAPDLPVALKALRAFHFRGANVTLPYKQAVIPLLDEVSELSQKIGAVNTIVNENGRLVGTTTDPIGFREGFYKAGHSFEKKSVAILGNGGSARTIAFTLAMMEQTLSITLVARDLDKSRTLADEVFAKTGIKLNCYTLNEYTEYAEGIQVVVNTTPLGMLPAVNSSPLPEEALRPGQVIYDIVYTPENTLLLQMANKRGLQTVGGLGMLIYQGAAAFKIWTGIDCDPGLLFSTTRQALTENLLAKKPH